jgi:hypothetical protein
MTKEDDHRKHAADLLQMAQRAATSADKSRLLQMAESWLDLADRAGKRSGERAGSATCIH